MIGCFNLINEPSECGIRHHKPCTKQLDNIIQPGINKPLGCLIGKVLFKSI